MEKGRRLLVSRSHRGLHCPRSSPHESTGEGWTGLQTGAFVAKREHSLARTEWKHLTPCGHCFWLL